VFFLGIMEFNCAFAEIIRVVA